MKSHEFADIFPMMDNESFNNLKKDIKEHGLQDPITVYEGKILDGRNRYNACKQLKIKPKTEEYKGKDPLQFVMSTNLHRRNLNKSQRAVVGRRWKIYYSKFAKERQKGGQGGLLLEPVPQAKIIARDKAGEVAGVSGRYIDEADKLIEEHPEAEKKIMEEGEEITKIKRDLREEKREEKRKEDTKKVELAKSPEEVFENVKFTTIVIDPPWDWDDEGDVNQMGRAKPDYHTLPFEDIKNLPVPDLLEEDAHVYLWVTNRSLPKGFELLKQWGCRYITCITWCKPSIGMGNYYRGSSEQILFGVKGSLGLKRKDIGTWFEAKRPNKKHSAKPDEFYEMVEKCSPGLYLDMFGRKKREGWYLWGNEDGK